MDKTVKIYSMYFAEALLYWNFVNDYIVKVRMLVSL